MALKWVERHSDIESGSYVIYHAAILDNPFKAREVEITGLLKVKSTVVVNGLDQLDYAIDEDYLVPADQPTYKLDHIRQIQREFLALQRPIVVGPAHVAADDDPFPARHAVSLSDEARNFSKKYGTRENYRMYFEAIRPYIDIQKYSGDALAVFAVSFDLPPTTMDLASSGYRSMNELGSFVQDRQRLVEEFKKWERTANGLPKIYSDALLPDGERPGDLLNHSAPK